MKEWVNPLFLNIVYSALKDIISHKSNNFKTFLWFYLYYSSLPSLLSLLLYSELEDSPLDSSLDSYLSPVLSWEELDVPVLSSVVSWFDDEPDDEFDEPDDEFDEPDDEFDELFEVLELDEPEVPDELYDEFELLLFEFDEFDEFDEFEVFDELEDIPLDEELPLSLVAFLGLSVVILSAG